MPIFKHKFVVRFADVDHAKIVYYPKFFDYFHIAFEEMFRERLGSSAYLDLLDTQKIGFPVVKAICDYKSPVRFADVAETSLRLQRLGTKSVVLAYQVHVVSGAPRLCAEGEITCVVTNLDSFQSVEMSNKLRNLFLELSSVVG